MGKNLYYNVNKILPELDFLVVDSAFFFMKHLFPFVMFDKTGFKRNLYIEILIQILTTYKYIFSLINCTGIIGGKFLERGRVKKPDQPLYSTYLSEYYQAQDLYVGASVNFNRHKFVIIDADEYAFRYMEKAANEVSWQIH